MKLFTDDNPWITRDNRAQRPASRTTAASLNARHQAMLPPELLDGASVLDLGCCIGATGWWALQNGAQQYVGVETQAPYVEIAQSLFSEAWMPATIVQQDLIQWLDWRELDVRFDIGVLAGVLYGFLNPYKVLEMMTRCCDTIVIDTLYPLGMRNVDYAFIEMLPQQRMILADDDTHQAAGPGVRVSPRALDTIMASYGFESKTLTVPPSGDEWDAYNTLIENRAGSMMPLRYIRTYERGDNLGLQSVNDQIVDKRVTKKLPFATR